MSENNLNKRPDIYKQYADGKGEISKSLVGNEHLTQGHDQITKIIPNASTEGEIKFVQERISLAEEQIRVRREGEDLGLYGKDLVAYIAERFPEDCVRHDLIKEVKKSEVVYDEPVITEEEVRDYLNDLEVETTKEEAKEEENITNKLNELLNRLSVPQYDAPFELVPLPSLGRQYGLDKYIKMAFLNASDENILTNSNIMKSGKFLEVLFSRKILSNVKYGDLLPSDRDALMIWLRGTAYGSIYPIQVIDPKTDEYFDVDIDLSKLKKTDLKLRTNTNGLFEYISDGGVKIEFKFLTVNQIEKLQKQLINNYEVKGELYDETMTDFMYEMIHGIDGEYDRIKLRKKLNYLSLKVLNGFKKFLKDNDFGIDFNLKVKTLGGEFIETPFPFNPEFFWVEP